jgi:transcription antitermination protein NusB
MVSRRLLRIKALQTLYSHIKGDRNFVESEKELLFSIRKSFDLLFFILKLVFDLRDYSNERILQAKKKIMPTPEDLNPNTHFIDNKVIAYLRENTLVDKYLHNKKLSWINYQPMIKDLYNQLEASDEFKQYMQSESDFNQDKKIVEFVLNEIVLENESIFQNLEEQSIFWNTEVDYIVIQLSKIVKGLKSNLNINYPLVNLEVDADDLEFVKRLLHSTINNYDEYKSLIDQYTKNWDVDRIAFMDILLMQMAINEAVEFPSIPEKVTLNEYIDIAKAFSSPQSGHFINGILDKIFTKLNQENKIKKSGRGLIGKK